MVVQSGDLSDPLVLRMGLLEQELELAHQLRQESQDPKALPSRLRSDAFAALADPALEQF